MSMFVQNRGSVRGGNNSYGKLHVAALMPQFANEEEMTVFMEEVAHKLVLSIGFDGIGSNNYELVFGYEKARGFLESSFYFRLICRRHFVILPAFIRLIIEAGGDLEVMLWDCGEYGSNIKYRLSNAPADFWREVALAQAYRIDPQ